MPRLMLCQTVLSFLPAPAPSETRLLDVLNPGTVLHPVLRPRLLLQDPQPPDFAGITGNMEMKLQTVGNPVPFWETSSPAGGFSYPSCRGSLALASK